MIHFAWTVVLMAAQAVASPVPGPPEKLASCLRPAEIPATPDQKKIAAALDRIEAIAPGSDPLIGHWRTGAAPLCLDHQPFEALGYFTPDPPLIVLDARLTDGGLAAVLVHELRHMVQNDAGLCPTTALSRIEYERQMFVIEADALAITTLYASRARKAGDPSLWRALTTILPHSADVAAAFDRAQHSGATEAGATARAFAAWGQDEDRVEAYHLSSCSAYLDALDRENLLPGTEIMYPDILPDLCLMPEGEFYGCQLLD